MSSIISVAAILRTLDSPSPAHAATASAADFWQNQSIYQIITDRFYDGDPSNNDAEGTYRPGGHSGTSVHGGDFKGIELKLDYIQALGATAVWISPIVLNVNGEFHGYAGRDFFSVAPHWGTLEDLRRLTAAAHARGMLVIQDVIVNHGGDLVMSDDRGYGHYLHPPAGYHLRYRDSRRYAPPFNTNAAQPLLSDLFHTNGLIESYSEPAQVELGELSGLDDFRTETPYIRSNMAEVCKYWIKEAGFDAFRVDTVKHVEMGFWKEWCPAVRAFARQIGRTNFFMFGEVLDASDARCGSYTGTRSGGTFALDSVLDYPLYFKIKEVFAKASGRTKLIEDRYAALPANYDPIARDHLVTFLDNHDQPRFLSPELAGTNIARLQLALTFLYTARGIPCLYYGTEQGFNGGTDPYDREDMFAGQFEQGPSLGDNFNMTHPLFLLVAKLQNFRRLYPALRSGIHRNVWSDPRGPGLLAWSRTSGTQQILVILNTAASSQQLPSVPTAHAAGAVLVNLFDPTETLTISAEHRTPPVTVPAASAKIFIPQSQILPLDPLVLESVPAHDATAVRPNSSLVLRFNKPMDKSSVEKALSTAPAVHGSFVWSAENDKVTFTPNDPGFPSQTLISVRLEGTARDTVSSNAIHGAFEMRFRTAN